MKLSKIRTFLFGDHHLREMRGANGAPYLLPIRLTVFYLIFSVLIYIVCPFQWITYKPVLFYTLLTLYIAALWFGYRLGLMSRINDKTSWKAEYTQILIKILSPLIVVNFLFYVVNIFRDYGFAKPEFLKLFKQMWIGIQNPGYGYVLRLHRITTLKGANIMGGSAFSAVNYLWAFVKYPIILGSMLYFKHLKLYAKVFAVLYLTATVMFYMSIGTNIDILGVFLFLEMPAILSFFSHWRNKTLSAKRIIQLVASLLAGILLIFSYFTWMMVSRGGINRYDDPSYNVGGISIDIGQNKQEKPPAETLPPETVPVETVPVETEAVETKPAETAPVSTTPAATQSPAKTEKTSRVPPIIMKFWVSFSSYFTQGYYGMSQALTLPWVPMFGVGNSMFLVDLVSRNVTDIDQYTYQVRMEPMGWDSDIQWHSMYTWLANDVSFYGVVIIMLLIGLLFGAMFKDAISSDNPFAKMSIFYFMLMIIFIPCNNQLAQRADTMFSFILLVLCWIFSHHPLPFMKKILRRKKRG